MKNQDILKTIDSKKNEIVKFLQSLIQFKSVNPPGDTSKIARYIKEYISKRGLECELYQQEKTKVNAVGTLSGNGDKKFIWNGHLDVVPISKPDGWSVDPWEGKVVNSKIMGRGTADMKGSIAAVISAACILADSGVKLSGDWVLAFSTDEESGGEMGAEYLVKNGILSGDACIVGEPTSLNRLGVGEKGVLWLKIKAEGRPAHAGLSFLGDNAIEKLYHFISKLHKIEEIERKHSNEIEKILSIIIAESKKAKNAEFSKEIFQRVMNRLVMNVGMMQGGTKINIVPSSAEAIVDIRILPGMTHETVMDEIEEILKESGIQGISFETVLKAEASYQNIDNPFINFMKETVRNGVNIEPTLYMISGFTDARFFRAKGIPTVVYGCGGENFHGVDEYITIDNLISTTKVYALTAMNFLKLQ
ncbi:MAG: M20 family metallopeptidase [Promethearchaeota archaeon]|jgi:succinyl-diaminopimelate desuccinylase